MEIIVETESKENIPSYASLGASGADVRANLQEPVVIPPGKSALIPTGLRFDIPPGCEIQVRPRSSFALKHQITVLNTPGTIDSDYKGEVKVILINHSDQPFTVEPKMRIAQLVVAPIIQASFVLGAVATNGRGGFGSTGSH